jgi:hypothetical protein
VAVDSFFANGMDGWSIPEAQMRVIGEIDEDLLRHDVINEMESEGVQITINAGEQLLSVLLPAYLPKDLLVRFTLRLKLITTENLIDDYEISSKSTGELNVVVHYRASKYREIG